MHLQALFSLLPLSLIPFRPSDILGKPSKLLQIGRLPALGCTPLPHTLSLHSRTDNTWNAYGCNINETVLLENAQIMKEASLLDAGYKYIVIDGPSCLWDTVDSGRLLDVE